MDFLSVLIYSIFQSYLNRYYSTLLSRSYYIVSIILLFLPFSAFLRKKIGLKTWKRIFQPAFWVRSTQMLKIYNRQFLNLSEVVKGFLGQPQTGLKPVVSGLKGGYFLFSIISCDLNLKNTRKWERKREREREGEEEEVEKNVLCYSFFSCCFFFTC